MEPFPSASQCCPSCGAKIGSHDSLNENLDLTLLVRENKKFMKINVKKIKVIECMKDYLKIHTKNKIIITHMTMGKIESLLDNKLFWRLSRSFIVNKTSIHSITPNMVEMDNKMLVPIGVNYRDFIKEVINTGFI